MKIGFTTSFPVEVILAAGHTPVDMNNIFVENNSEKYVEIAEFDGYPRNICSWIKGMYGVAIENNLKTVVGVVEGDCSNTHSLMQTLAEHKIDIVSFSFPYDKDYDSLDREIIKLEKYFNVSRSEVLKEKKRLDRIRKKLIYLDELSWKENLVTGFENHIWLVTSSDFNGNPDKFEAELDEFLSKVEKRKPLVFDKRFGFLGVPPIIFDMYDFLLENGVNVVYNEIQRQFAMPYLEDDIVMQYLRYTYPYTVHDRLQDINIEIKKRSLDAVISYVQSFCHRQIDNIILQKKIDLPLLTVEGDKPEKLDARTKLRIESFLDMIE